MKLFNLQPACFNAYPHKFSLRTLYFIGLFDPVIGWQNESEKHKVLTIYTRMSNNSQPQLLHSNENSPEVVCINSWLSTLRDYLPIASLFVVFISYLRLNAYYTYYSIEILDFISLGELVAPIINNIFNFLAWTIVGGIALFGGLTLMINLAQFSNERRNTKGYLIFNNIYLDHFAIFVHFILVIGGPIFLMFFVMINAAEYINLRLFIYPLYSLLVIMLITTIGFLLFKRPIYKVHFFISSAILSFAIGSIMDGRKIAEQFYDSKDLHDSYVQVENSSTNYCSNEKWLIGLTDNYAIFYIPQNSKPEIINRSIIKKISPSILPIKSWKHISVKKSDRINRLLIENWFRK